MLFIWLLLDDLLGLITFERVLLVAGILVVLQITGFDVVQFVETQILRSALGI